MTWRQRRQTAERDFSTKPTLNDLGGALRAHERARQDEIEPGLERAQASYDSLHALAAFFGQRPLIIARIVRPAFFRNGVPHQIENRHIRRCVRGGGRRVLLTPCESA